jgi:hypothetical protein
MDASDHIDAQARDGLIRQLVDWDALAERLIEVRAVAGAGTRGGRVCLTDGGRALLNGVR